MKIKANGITFNYQVNGPDGAPWIMFSNSFMTTLHMWDGQARDLSDAYRVLRYDQRGHGGTDAPAGRYTFDLLIADAVALLDALNIKRTSFAGLSMGGATALGFAQQHPDRLDKVIVCDSPCQSTPQSTQRWNEQSALAQKEGMDPLVEATVGRWFPPDVLNAKPPYIDAIRAMIRGTAVTGFVGGAAALADHDYASKAASVTRPTMFMVGEKDGVLPPSMRKLSEAVKGSRFVELPGAGHISNLDQPKGFNSAVRDFLKAA
jgi:3-oxoadipate enol-lactonase